MARSRSGNRRLPRCRRGMMTDGDRHGNARLYVRRYGRKIRIRKKLGTEAFALAYAEAIHALEQEGSRSEIVKAAPGTFGWLAACYFASTELNALDPALQTRRRLYIESCLREPRKLGSRDLMRDCPISVLSPAHVRMLRDRKAGNQAPPTTGARPAVSLTMS